MSMFKKFRISQICFKISNNIILILIIFKKMFRFLNVTFIYIYITLQVFNA